MEPIGPWVARSADHPWYWICQISRSLSSMMNNFKHLYLFSGKEWYKMQVHVCIFPKQFTMQMVMNFIEYNRLLQYRYLHISIFVKLKIFSHLYDVTQVLRCLISLDTWLFVQRFIKDNNKRTWNYALLTLCAGNPPVTGGFPAQRASNMECVLIVLYHHPLSMPLCMFYLCLGFLLSWHV